MSQTKLPFAKSVKTPPTTSVVAARPPKKRSLEEYESMTTEELIAALQERDDRIDKLQNECKRLKKTTVVTPTTSAKSVSPEQLKAQAERLRNLIYKGIKSQMKWKPSCKTGKARFSYEGICDEGTFRALMNLTGDKEKTKGKKMDVEEFEDQVMNGQGISASVRYDNLYLRGKVNVSFSQKDSTIKITGAYGLCGY